MEKIGTIQNRLINFSCIVLYTVFITLLLFLFHTSSVIASDVTLSWNQPVSNADGSVLTDLAGYKVNIGTNSGTYSQSIDIGDVTSYQLSNLIEGTTYYFAVTSYDHLGNESSYSNEVSKTINVVVNSFDDFIIDNNDKEAYYSGDWYLSDGITAFNEDSVQSSSEGSTYTFDAPYFYNDIVNVFLWWTYESSRCTDVPIEIYDDEGLLDIKYVNQSVKDSRWNYIGTYNFKQLASIQIYSGYDSCSTNADAVRFVSSGFIIDNNDKEAYYSGDWYLSDGITAFNEDSVQSSSEGSTYTFDAPYFNNDVVDVYLWWTYESSRCTDVPIEIYDDEGLLDIKYVNQSVKDSRWNYIGRYDFKQLARIQIYSGYDSCSTNADAVKFHALSRHPLYN